MKMSLRNFALAGATLLATGAWAGGNIVDVAEGFDMKLVWEQITPFSAQSTGRYGVGVANEAAVYVVDHTTSSIVKFTAEGHGTVITGIPGTPFGITTDDAGNLIWNPGALSSEASKGDTKLYVLPAGKTSLEDIIEIELTAPEGLETNGRVDALPRIVGNILTEAWYIGVGGTPSEKTPQAVSYKIVDKVQKEAELSIALPINLGTFVTPQAGARTIEEIGESADPSSNIYLFVANGSLWVPNEENNAWVEHAKPNKGSEIGFDYFDLDGERYYVMGCTGGTVSAANWQSSWQIVRYEYETAEVDGAEVTTITPVVMGKFETVEPPFSSGGNYGSFVCFPNNEKSVVIRRWCSSYGAQEVVFGLEGWDEVPVEGKNSTRAAYAYDITAGENTLSYKLTDEAKSVNAILTDANGNETVVALPGVAKGENTVTLSKQQVGVGSYSVAIEVVSNVEGEGDIVEIYTAPENQAAVVRGGVVVIRDTDSDAFGYIGVAHGKAGGVQIYNPAGELQGTYHKGFSGWSTGSQSSPMRGDANGGLMVFADWSDPCAGEWVIDPLNPETAPYNMLPSEDKEDSGLASYNGVKVGSSTPCVAFSGKGENTKMYTFDEDIYNNEVVRYAIGTNTTLMVAPELVCNLHANLANTNVEIEPVEFNDKGYFFTSQVRAVGQTNAGIWGFALHNAEGETVVKCGDYCEEVPSVDENGTPVVDENGVAVTEKKYLIDGCSSGIALSDDGSLFAVLTYNDVKVFTVEWSEDAFGDLKPEFTEYASLPLASTIGWSHIAFDHANNLHAYIRELGGYHVYALTGESEVVTPAKAGVVLTVSTVGVDNVSVEDAPAVYYNLQGQRVAADNLRAGIYVKVQGQKATKVVVR